MKYLLGIGDASEYDTNPRTDWRMSARHGCSWGLVRASTTGAWVNGRPSLKKDVMFELNAANMQGAEIKRCTYAWFDPRVKQVSALDQAYNFLDCIKATGPGDLGVVIDAEDSGSIVANMNIGDHMLTWLKFVEGVLKIRPRIYTNLGFTSNYLFNSTVRCDWLTDYEIIIANWGVNSPTVPQPWAPETWRAWQYRANAPGSYYGFNASIVGRPAPQICLAIWREDD